MALCVEPNMQIIPSSDRDALTKLVDRKAMLPSVTEVRLPNVHNGAQEWRQSNLT